MKQVKSFRSMKMKSVKKIYDLTGKVALITGGAGMLGMKHAEAIAEAGGSVVLADLDRAQAASAAKEPGPEADGAC